MAMGVPYGSTTSYAQSSNRWKRAFVAFPFYVVQRIVSAKTSRPAASDETTGSTPRIGGPRLAFPVSG